jgi:leucyl-tRNA synthetase
LPFLNSKIKMSAVKPYIPKEVEKAAREKWETEKTFKIDLKNAKKPFYNLMMFPYPSGEGLHVGHVYAFGGADTYGHFKKMQGYDVFEPMGFDSFGIHSENYAIKVGKHPRQLIEETTKYFREEQLKKLGALFDWETQVITSEPNYYKWTQWIFSQLFKAGLAVRKKANVDWCPSCKTVLADEQVINGKCERCSTEVIQKELEQWFFKITDYAERLLENTSKINWSTTTTTMQRNWIGKSEGAEIEFKLRNIPGQEDDKHSVKVYTTRPDTLFGATFVVVSPELAKSCLEVGFQARDTVKDYVKNSLNKTEIERQEEGKDKTGVDMEIKAVHPISGKLIPVWVADYVLGSYGTGAIMAVPAHDQRDWEFAKHYKLEIIPVVEGGDINKEAFVAEGSLINSGEFDGQSVKEAIVNITNYLEKNHLGAKKTNFHLRDWLISRQRYWGPPIPMIFCEKCASEEKSWFTTDEAKGFKKINNLDEAMKGWYPVADSELPVRLPELEDYQPKGTGISPLASLPEFLNVKCPECGSSARRETDVSDTFLDSSWYFLRYPSTQVEHKAFDKELTKKWLPVDNYIGGNEHAVLHLLYSRFITMVLSDLGHLDFEEPFEKFRAHALITYQGAKMSKSRGNVINPNDYMENYGADTLRMYLLFIGPYEQGGDFSDRAIAGMFRFLNRAWNIVQELKDSDNKTSFEFNTKLQALIKRVGEDLENLKFNTAIAALMEFVNEMYKNKTQVNRDVLSVFVSLLAPFAPHITEELWSELGGSDSIHKQVWPAFDPSALDTPSVTLVVQINGKVRDKVEIQKGLSEAEVSRLVLDRPKIQSYTKGKKVRKTIYVKEKVLNLVV